MAACKKSQKKEERRGRLRVKEDKMKFIDIRFVK